MTKSSSVELAHRFQFLYYYRFPIIPGGCFIYQYRDSTSARVETLSGFHSSTSRFLSHSLGAQDYSQTPRCKNLEITQVGLSLKRSHKTY